MRSLIAAVAVALAAAVLGGAGAATIQFSDQTVASGLVHSPSMFFDMNAGGMFAGGAVADFDRDGWYDLFLIGGGFTADALFLNNGDGTFADHAASWGVDAMHRGQGATAGDFNGDGWPDLYVTSAGVVTGPNAPGAHRLYRNNGDGSFTDIAVSAGVSLGSPTYFNGTGSAFGDYDLDGDLDLFVCTWDGMNGNKLFRNNGDETFTDVTAAAGIAQTFFGYSPRFIDMNGDRWPELLVAADFGTSRYFVNDGDGTFTDGTNAAGVGLDENGMGTTVGDFNRDGLPDWFVTSIYESGAKLGNFLYVNQGGDTFVDLPESAGAKHGGWGWGAEAMDFDHDGFLDIVETNGWNNQYENLPAYFYRNNGNMTFTEVQAGSGFDHTGQGRSVLTLDYDRDGDMDVVLTAFNEPVTLFRNDLSGADINWIQVALDTSGDPTKSPDGYGAKVTATSNSGTQYSWINGGASYLGRSQPVAHFGLATDTTVDVTVEWPDGTTTTVMGLAANQRTTLTPSVAGAPGEASMQASYNRTTGEIDINFTPACDATDHTIYYGDLANVSSYTYSGAACFRGNSGVASFDPGMASVYFMIVGTTGVVEGSYGRDGAGFERPEHVSGTACDLSQDLSGVCN